MTSFDQVEKIKNDIFALLEKAEESSILKKETVDLISKETGIELVCYWIVSLNSNAAFLRVGSGNYGDFLMNKQHSVKFSTSQHLFAPVLSNELRISNGWTGEIYGCKIQYSMSLDISQSIKLISKFEVAEELNSSMISYNIPAPAWEIVIPARYNNHVFGMFSFKTAIFENIHLEDCFYLQWLVDQLTHIFQNEL